MLTAAETAAPPAAAAANPSASLGAKPPAPGILASPLPLLVFMGVLFYFMILRPQKSAQNKHQDMIRALKPGDKVLTKGGIYGTVAQVKEDVLVLKISDNAKVEVSRSYIDDRIAQPEQA